MNKCHSNFFLSMQISFFFPLCFLFPPVLGICVSVLQMLWELRGCILVCIAYDTYLANSGCEAKVCEINGNPQMPVLWKPHCVQAPKEGRPRCARDTILQILWKPHCPSQVNHGIPCQHTVVVVVVLNKDLLTQKFLFYPQKAEIIKIWEGGWVVSRILGISD